MSFNQSIDVTLSTGKKVLIVGNEGMGTTMFALGLRAGLRVDGKSPDQVLAMCREQWLVAGAYVVKAVRKPAATAQYVNASVLASGVPAWGDRIFGGSLIVKLVADVWSSGYEHDRDNSEAALAGDIEELTTRYWLLQLGAPPNMLPGAVEDTGHLHPDFIDVLTYGLYDHGFTTTSPESARSPTGDMYAEHHIRWSEYSRRVIVVNRYRRDC